MATAVADKKALKEVRSMKFRIFTPLRFREASVDQKTGIAVARVVIITEGLGNLRDRNYYTASAVKSSAEVFRGKQFYINHPSQSEEEDRPERDVRDLAGYFVETAVTTVKDPDTGETLTACLATLKFSTSQGGRDALEQVKTALQYANDFPDSKDVYCGISINGGGVSHPGEIDGMNVNMVTEIQEAFSADIVTKPARGGKFLALVQEAEKTAAWRRKRAKESRNASHAVSGARTSPRKDTRMTTTANGAKKIEVKKPVVKKKTVETVKIGPKKMARLKAGLIEALKESKKGVLTINGLRVIVEAATATGKKMSALGEKLGKMQAAAEEPKGQLSDMIMDLQQDLGDLAAALGMGGAATDGDDGADAAVGDDAAGDAAAQDEGEDEQGTLGDMGTSGAGDTMTSEDEDEEEAEEEAEDSTDEAEDSTDEAEGEEESKTDESEDSTDEAEDSTDESEDSTDESEGKTDEAEDSTDEAEGEEESKTDESEDEEEGEGVGAPPAGAPKPMRMAYKCAQCGETNQVAPPKGFMLSKTDEAGAIKLARSNEAQALASTISRLKRVLKTKEGRFVATNKQYAKVMEQNIALRAEVIGHRRYGKARKMLAEAKVPRTVLSVTDLLRVEPESWPTQIKMAQNVMRGIAAREGDVFNNAGTGAGGGNVNGGKGKEQKIGEAAISTFTESYKADASR